MLGESRNVRVLLDQQGVVLVLGVAHGEPRVLKKTSRILGLGRLAVTVGRFSSSLSPIL